MNFILLSLITLGFSFPVEVNPLRALYNSLNPQSVAQALAFYELYPQSEEGKKALARATELLRGNSIDEVGTLYPFVNKLSEESEKLSQKEIELIERLAVSLPNRKLKGYEVKSEKEVLALPSDEIDLGKALLLSQLSEESDAYSQARSYSALLDLMALQIVARLPEKATMKEKINAINAFIFDEMHFRFPPQSVYAQDIDLYTFLPSVMDNHLGVCLGVTALYLSISQRLDLPLEIITPPGHIYVRYREGDQITNIETTARGIDIPTENYLSVNTFQLQERNLKEVIGMMYVNEASVYLHNGAYEKAIKAYEKASFYLPNEPIVKELLGYSYLSVGREEEGEALLQEIRNVLPEGAISKQSLAEDFLDKKVDLEGIQTVFMLVDETYDTILEKQKQLQQVIEKYPDFREGLLQLAVSWIQLNRAKEAIEILKRYHALDATNPSVEYYLAVLHGERYDFKSCWHYLKHAESITQKHDFTPQALEELRRVLTLHCPE
ncbi:MAG: transglutaminase family protein [Chlamydiales bacterium]